LNGRNIDDDNAGEYELAEGTARVDFDRVTDWLAGSYWSPGISRAVVERAAAGSSLVIGVYSRISGSQVAYARVVSDRTTFAWLCDVIVDESHRGRGIGRRMVHHALAHPDHQGLRRWMLGTADAHGVYAACGFAPPPHPERLMTFIPAKDIR